MSVEFKLTPRRVDLTGELRYHRRQTGESLMNKRLDEALTRVKALPDEQQGEIAELLFDLLEQDRLDIRLTPEQIAEIERGLADSEPYASDAEVRAVFQRLTK
jgi:hypothetical protein